LATPADEIDLQESEDIKFDFLQHFKSLGDSIMSLFRRKKSEEIDNDTITIEEEPVAKTPPKDAKTKAS
jgi:hypothetical protein